MFETLHNFAYEQKRNAITSYMNVLVDTGSFDHPTPLSHSMEAAVNSGGLTGARIHYIHGEHAEPFAAGNAPKLFIPASMIKPVVLGAAIRQGNTMDWIDSKTAYRLIVDSDNQTFEDVVRQTLPGSMNASSLPQVTDELLQGEGIQLTRDAKNRRCVDIVTLAHAYNAVLPSLPFAIQEALVVPQNLHNTSDPTGKVISRLQARLKNTKPFLFKIGLDKDDNQQTITSYFIQTGPNLCVGYCIGGRFAATKHVLNVASHLMQSDKQ